jgi:phage-related baseplate assembly protein
MASVDPIISQSRFSVIDLSQLSDMQVLEDLDSEATIAARMIRFKEIWISHDPPAGAAYDVENLEFDPTRVTQELNTYFETLLRDRVNEAAKAVTLAFAIGSDLNAIASNFPVGPRLPVVDNPRGTWEEFPEDYESDDRYRRRTQLSLNPLSPHGPAGAYMFWALTADPLLRDASEMAIEGERSQVFVTVLADDPVEPRPNQQRLLAIRAYLLDAYRKAATDVLVVQAPKVVDISYKIQVWFFPPPDRDTLLDKLKANLAELIEEQRWLGFDHTHMAIYAMLRENGVHRAVILEPAADVLVDMDTYIRCHDENGHPRIELIYMGRDE